MNKRPARRSRAEADALVEAYEKSGQSRREFCAAAGLSSHRLDYYRRRLGRTRSRQQRMPAELPRVNPQWVEVETAKLSPRAPLVLILPAGLRIEVPVGFDARSLRELLAVAGGG